MNARLEGKLRTLAIVVLGGALAGAVYSLMHDQSVVIGAASGIVFSSVLGGLEIATMDGPVRAWLNGLPFSVSLMVRSAGYAIIIVLLQWLRLAERVSGYVIDATDDSFWSNVTYAATISVLFNLILAITNLIGPRAFLNFITGRYHAPIEEDRFVLFVDIAGSTGLAQQLGGVGIHRFLDRTFRLLTRSVVDYRGEVLDYVGDEVIVTWPARAGAIDHRPLRCFVAMRQDLVRYGGQMQREFGAAPHIRGSLHFGPVIIGEIGDVKRAIVFNGDVMNTAARLEELSRNVEGGFVASRAAMDQFAGVLPFAMRPLGKLSIRGRADGIDAMGLDMQHELSQPK